MPHKQNVSSTVTYNPFADACVRSQSHIHRSAELEHERARRCLQSCCTDISGLCRRGRQYCGTLKLIIGCCVHRVGESRRLILSYVITDARLQAPRGEVQAVRVHRSPCCGGAVELLGLRSLPRTLCGAQREGISAAEGCSFCYEHEDHNSFVLSQQVCL